jgi:hypothetical protein
MRIVSIPTPTKTETAKPVTAIPLVTSAMGKDDMNALKSEILTAVSQAIEGLRTAQAGLLERTNEVAATITSECKAVRQEIAAVQKAAAVPMAAAAPAARAPEGLNAELKARLDALESGVTKRLQALEEDFKARGAALNTVIQEIGAVRSTLAAASAKPAAEPPIGLSCGWTAPKGVSSPAPIEPAAPPMPATPTVQIPVPTPVVPVPTAAMPPAPPIPDMKETPANFQHVDFELPVDASDETQDASTWSKIKRFFSAPVVEIGPKKK